MVAKAAIDSTESKRPGVQPTRQRLIAAATAAFARSGYEGARINDIARRAKANKQLVYHYFGSKDALYKAVVEEIYLKFRGDDKSIASILAEPDPEAALRRFAEHLFKRTSSMSDFQRLLQDLNVQTNRKHLKGLEGVREAYVRLVETLRDILERGARSGVFRTAVDAKEFYLSLAGACSVRISNAATLSFMIDVDLMSAEGAAKSQDEAIRLLIDGIRASPTEPMKR